MIRSLIRHGIATILFVLVPVVIASMPGSVSAQQDADPQAVDGVAPTPVEEDPERIGELIATLEDDEARQRLVDQLRLLADAAAPAEDPAPTGDGVTALTGLAAWFNQVVRAVTDLPGVWQWAADGLATPEVRDRTLQRLADLAIVAAAGAIAFVLARLAIGPALGRLRAADRAGLAQRIARGAAQVPLHAIPFVLFWIAAMGAVALLSLDRPTAVVSQAVGEAALIVGALYLIGRALFAPRSPHLRPVPIEDRPAAILAWAVGAVGVLVGAGHVLVESWFVVGMPSAVRDSLLSLIGLVALLVAIQAVLRSRGDVARAIAGRSAGWLQRRLAPIWHVLAIGYLIAAYLVWAMNVADAFGFLALATALTIVVVLAAAGLNVLIERALAPSYRAQPDRPYWLRRFLVYRRAVTWVVRVALIVVAAVVLAEIWRLGGFDLAASAIGRQIIATVVSVVFVVAIAIAGWEAVRAVVERISTRTDAEGQPLEYSARFRTLLPLIRNASMVVIGTIATMVVLSEIGIDIGPLLAGAGVIGLAVGFGAQTLVQDVITGLFIILEDTISVGDVVTVGSHGGLVEGMTIRTLRLRDLAGNVHTVPFSQVSSVMNMTREFSYYVFDIGVAYREDVDQVTEVIVQLGAEMQQDEPYASAILEPIEILGLDAFADSAVIVKARIKTRPIQQWTVGREFNRRLKRRFDELGIEIPYPHTTLYFGADKQGRAAAANLSVDLPALVEALAAGFGRMERPSETREEERERPPAASPTPAAPPAASSTPAKPPSPVPDLRDDDDGM